MHDKRTCEKMHCRECSDVFPRKYTDLIEAQMDASEFSRRYAQRVKVVNVRDDLYMLAYEAVS